MSRGQQIASGSEDTTIRLWDLTGQELHVMKGHTESVTALAWSPRGSRLASGSWDKTIRFWNPRTGRSGGPVLEGHTYRVFDLEWHPEGTMLASVGDRTLRLWALDGTPVKTVKSERDNILTLVLETRRQRNRHRHPLQQHPADRQSQQQHGPGHRRKHQRRCGGVGLEPRWRPHRRRVLGPDDSPHHGGRPPGGGSAQRVKFPRRRAGVESQRQAVGLCRRCDCSESGTAKAFH